MKDRAGNIIYPCPYYPVGSIYLSVNNINPSTYFGGTWEAIGQGRCIIGAGVPTANNTNFFGGLGIDPSTFHFNSGEMGGQYYHQLTTGELPKHGHIQYLLNPSSQGYSNDDMYFGAGAQRVLSYGNDTLAPTDKGWWNSAGTSYVGSDTQHNNMPPYLAVYMWKRTA